MQSSAEIQIIGYVHKDPKFPMEEKYPNWVTFTVVVNRKYKDKTGAEQEDTTWFDCKSSSEKLSANIKQIVKDRQGILIKGTPKPRAYLANDGEAKGAIEIVIHSFNILTYPNPKEPEAKKEFINTNVIQDDEIPF